MRFRSYHPKKKPKKFNERQKSKTVAA